MSTATPIERMREEAKRIEGELEQLREQKKKIDERYDAVAGQEKKIIDEMRKCRDPYQYNKMDMQLNMISRSRKSVEAEKVENERKIRGYEEELNRVKARIGYLKPGK